VKEEEEREKSFWSACAEMVRNSKEGLSSFFSLLIFGQNKSDPLLTGSL
jgi:hypothetical protein